MIVVGLLSGTSMDGLDGAARKTRISPDREPLRLPEPLPAVRSLVLARGDDPVAPPIRGLPSRDGVAER